MKKSLLYLFLFFISITGSSKTLDDICKDFSKVAKAENINLNKFTWSCIKVFTRKDADSNLIKKISSLKIIDLEGCLSDTKMEFAKQIETLDMEDLTLLMKVKDDDDNILILSKDKKQKITEFIIIILKDPLIVRLKGNFALSDLPEINQKYGTKKSLK